MALTVESDSITHGERVPDEHSFGVPDGEGKAARRGRQPQPAPALVRRSRGHAVVRRDRLRPRRARPTASDVNQEGRTLPEDAARADFAHWLLVDISPDVTELPEGAGSDGDRRRRQADRRDRARGHAASTATPDFLAGDPDMGGTYGDYDGPFPPFNDERLHHYHFVVYALDVPSLGLEGEFKLDDVREAIEGHVLDQGELVATYTLNADKL